MRLSEIEYGSLLSYSPYGTSEEARRSRTVMRKLKNDEYLESPKILMSDYIAQGLKKDIEKLPFVEYFKENPILVPTPNSSLTKKGYLWVPQRLAIALVKQGLGKDVEACLHRRTPVKKASTSKPDERPKPVEHYESMSVELLTEPKEILLIDDVVTRGATLLGAANKLADAFPKARIRAFVVIRTITNPLEFVNINDPCKGKITLREDGTTLRRP